MLIALAIGVAMDAPLKGTLQSEAWVTDMRPGGRHFRKKITIADGMLLAMAVAKSFAACWGFN